jgi:hypothetical protein
MNGKSAKSVILRIIFDGVGRAIQPRGFIFITKLIDDLEKSGTQI